MRFVEELSRPKEVSSPLDPSYLVLESPIMLPNLLSPFQMEILNCCLSLRKGECSQRQ